MFRQSVKMAMKSIAANKMRSFLTMLGIIIGVIALVVLVSVVTSATSSVTDTIMSLGSNMMIVTITEDKGNPLSLSEVQSLTEIEEVAAVAPVSQITATVKKGYHNQKVNIYATTAPYYGILGLQLDSGRWLKNSDIENNTYVAVVNMAAADEFFQSYDVTGETISIDGTKFTIAGVTSKSNSLLTILSGGGKLIYLPYSTARRISGYVNGNVSVFYVGATSEDLLDETEAVLTNYLLERFDHDKNAFEITNMSSIANAMDRVTNILSIVLGGISAISLLVGGIGIMNIMLVSVTERTREIGIRKAIGAGQGSIMTQFLIEALVVSLLGCSFGILFSYIILQIVSYFAGDLMSFHLSGMVILVAVCFSTLIGLIFGIYPARKAARKPPIEALRFDG